MVAGGICVDSVQVAGPDGAVTVPLPNAEASCHRGGGPFNNVSSKREELSLSPDILRMRKSRISQTPAALTDSFLWFTRIPPRP